MGSRACRLVLCERMTVYKRWLISIVQRVSHTPTARSESTVLWAELPGNSDALYHQKTQHGLTTATSCRSGTPGCA